GGKPLDAVASEQRLAVRAAHHVRRQVVEVSPLEHVVGVAAVDRMTAPRRRRRSSAMPPSDSWWATCLTPTPVMVIGSMEGSSWKSADRSGLAPTMSPAETTKVGAGLAARSAAMCAARYAAPPARTPSIRADDPAGGSRLP